MTAATVADVRDALASEIPDRDQVERILYRLRTVHGVEILRGNPAYDAGLPLTRDGLTMLEPVHCERVAAFVAALLEREPLKSRPGYNAERAVLGDLVADLRMVAAAAGEPTGAQRDLRDAATKRDERDAQLRIEQAERAYHELVTDAIETDARQAEILSDRHVDEYPEPVDPDPQPATTAPDWV